MSPPYYVSVYVLREVLIPGLTLSASDRTLAYSECVCVCVCVSTYYCNYIMAYNIYGRFHSYHPGLYSSLLEAEYF